MIERADQGPTPAPEEVISSTMEEVISSTMSAGMVRPLNARSLALSSLLGTHPPVQPVHALVALAELFGIAGGTMRTALSRMVAAGDVVADDGEYRLAGHLLDRQHAQDVGRRDPPALWDGRWHTVVVTADQREPVERRHFRALMANHRFGELRPELWMRPANLPLPPPGDGWIATTGDLTGADGTTIAARLWDLAGVAATADGLLTRLDELDAGLDWDDPRSIPPAFTTSAAVVRFLRSEPFLPEPLAPAGAPLGALRLRYDVFEAHLQARLRAFLRNA